MKLLFDQNLSPFLVRRLGDLYPDSCHVRDVGMARVDDLVIWDHARDHGFVIVSKDADFQQRSFVLGPPPKVIWIRMGNVSTDQIETLPRRSAGDIANFVSDPEAAIIAIGA